MNQLNANQGASSARRARALRGVTAPLMAALALCVSLALPAPAPAQSQAGQIAVSSVDLPPCEAARAGVSNPVAVGVVLPHGSSHVVQYLGELSLRHPQIDVCAESWQPVLPHWWSPWPQALGRAYPFGLYLAGFLVAVGLLARATAHTQWHRVTLVGVLAVGGLSWALGTAAQAAFHAFGGQRWAYDSVISLRDGTGKIEWLEVPGARELDALLSERQILVQATVATAVQATATPPEVPTPAASSAAPAVSAAQEPQGRYRVAHRLNLRSGPGTQHEHLTTLSREAMVEFIGPREGDWWRLRTANGQEGWASSLWLRRPGEGLPVAGPQAMPKS